MKEQYNIKELCRKRGMKMKELAQRVGYARATSLSQALENGIPSNRLIDIADALGVSVPDLFVRDKLSITCPHCGKEITLKVDD